MPKIWSDGDMATAHLQLLTLNLISIYTISFSQIQVWKDIRNLQGPLSIIGTPSTLAPSLLTVAREDAPSPSTTHRSTSKTLLAPSLGPHTRFYSGPQPLYNLAISPASLFTLPRIPKVQLCRLDTTTPPRHGPGNLLALPADVDTQGMRKQLLRRLPFIAFELPRLACGENGDDSLPIIWFELVCRVDEDEAHGAGIDSWHGALDVEDCSCAA